MSNLICHSKRTTAINLDNVATIFHQEGESKNIFFIFNSIADEVVLEENWEFETQEEASEVYASILNRFTTEIVTNNALGQRR